MGRRYKLIISDLHVGTGHRPGKLNPWESFSADDKFAEFLRYYSTDYFEDEEVELIINGDFYDFLQVQVDGQFPDQVTERIALEKIRACIDGHPKLHKALHSFLRTPHKRVTVLPGNHDFDLVFPKVQEVFRERIGESRTDPRIQFICDREYYEFDGIQVHHGMQFEAMQYHNFRELFLTDHGSEPILNMPWGSIFVAKVITRLKEERPYIDKIRPFTGYLVRALIFDTLFALKVLLLASLHFVKTHLSLKHFRARMRQAWLIMREAEAYPDLAGKVKHLFDTHPDVHTIVLGHTHVPAVRQFEGDRRYVNTGCWTATISLEMSSYGRESKPTYAFIEYASEGARPTISLREWCGYHDIFRDIMF